MSYICSIKKLTTEQDTNIIFDLKTALKLKQWSVLSSSDGTTYNSTGDQITTATTGAGGMNNTNAWFRIQAPPIGGVTRELCIQRTTVNNYRLKYSYSAGFTGGTPGATRVPSATDEGVFFGSGTDAAPTGALLFRTTSNAYIMSLGDITDGYCFFVGSLRTFQSQVPDLQGCLFFDKISDNSISVGDVDGYLCYAHSGTNQSVQNETEFGNTTASPAAAFTWFKKGLIGEGYVSAFMFQYTGFSNLSINSDLGTNSITNKEDLLPLLYGRTLSCAAPNGYKGYSHMLKFLSSNRRNLDVLDVDGGVSNFITYGKLAVPWDGSTVIIR